MQATSTIYIDKWRVISEPLLKSYIKCYQLLESGIETSPGLAMVKGLEENDELRTVTQKTYTTAYTIARELGVFYEGDNEDFYLSKAANKYINGELSYEDYLKKYILYTEFSIDNKVVHPFEEIVQALSTETLALGEIISKCPKCVPLKNPSDSVRECFRLFIDRAVLAKLVSKNNYKYSLNISQEDLAKIIKKSGLSNEEFKNRYLGKGKDRQRNIVIDFIDKDIDTFKTSITQSKNQIIMQPLNQILYGPPGTGKTFSTITKALDIIGVEYHDYKEAQELFQEELGNRIEFVTMHQSFSYEDFVQGLKPVKGRDGVEFDYKNGVFKEICRRAKLFKSESGSTSNKDRIDFDVVYDYAFRTLIENDEQIELSRGQTKFIIHEHSEKTLWFETSVGTRHSRYTLAKKTLKKIYDAKSNDIIKSGNKGYFDATLEYLLEKEDELLKKPDIASNVNHVIILDEINRANLSKVFGELITLIEDDKRDKFSTTLPSGDPFTIPSNLYIIGTMNTADKSISMVDIALRRRFEFEAMYPKPKLVVDLEKRNFMESVNAIIRDRKTIDFQIGHSDFMKSLTFEDTLNRKVIPLLVEYFRNDMSTVKDIVAECIDTSSSVRVSESWFTQTGLVKVEKYKPN